MKAENARHLVIVAALGMSGAVLWHTRLAHEDREVGADSEVLQPQSGPSVGGEDAPSDTERDLRRRLVALERRVAQSAIQPHSPPPPPDSVASSDANPGDAIAQGAEIQVGLEAAFASIEVDQAASEQRALELRQAMAQNSAVSNGTQVGEVECSSTSCRITVAHADPESAERFRSMVSVFFPWSRVGHVTDEGTHSTVFATTDEDLVRGILVP